MPTDSTNRIGSSENIFGENCCIRVVASHIIAVVDASHSRRIFLKVDRLDATRGYRLVTKRYSKRYSSDAAPRAAIYVLRAFHA